MAILTASTSVDLSNFPDGTAEETITGGNSTGFQLVGIDDYRGNAQYFATVTGTGFTYDGFGDLTGGTGTGITLSGSQNFTLSGISFDFNSNYYDDGFIVPGDGTELFGIDADVASWLANGDSITGSGQNDTLLGFSGNDTINGGDGNDVIEGWSGNDLINGGDGSDRINGGRGNDTMLGGAGLDRFREGTGHGGGITLNPSGGSGAGNDSIDGGVITDRLNYNDLNLLSYVSAPNGVVINMAGISGDGSVGTGTAISTSTVSGNTGTDTFRNINWIEGSNFNDTITGSSALIFEQFEGYGGNDRLDGGAITDLINTDNANRVSYQFSTAGVVVDLAAGTASTTNATIQGNSGNDLLFNFSQVRGSNANVNGNDTLLGSNTTAFTELFEGMAGDDFIDGRGGFDIVRYDSATGGVIASLAGGTASGAGVGSDTFVNIEGIFGSAFNDSLVGGGAAAGLDYSNTALIEVFRGGAGNDTIDGGNGFDRADYAASTAGINVSLQDGLASDDGLGGSDTLVNIEQVRGSDFNDTIEGSDRNTYLVDGYLEAFEGRKGNDTIDGRGGFDVAQYNTARAGVNVNLLTGVASEDGYGTSDTLISIEGAIGSSFGDTLVGGATAGRIEGRVGNDLITGSNDAGAGDVLLGGEGNDTINGLNGNDTLDGGTGNDSLSGGGGNDNVLGGEGTDTIEGDDGNDRINGGAGNDLMLGGAGNDVFIEGNNYGGGIALSSSTAASVSAAGNDTMDGGMITDRINYTDNNVVSYFSATNGVVINMAGITGNGSIGQGTVTSTSTVAGNSGIDIIRNINIVEGSNFADTITGSSALIFEQIEGLGGNDVLNGGAITDLVNTDNANRVSYRSAGAGVVVDLAAGTALTTNATIAGSSGNDTISNFSQVRGSNHDDTLLGSNATTYTELFEGLNGNDFIDGRGGFDIIRYDNATGGVTVNLANGTASGAGNDTFVNIEGVFGSTFDDLLVGGNVNNGQNYTSDASKLEVLRGGAGNDTLDGGDGFDRADYASSTVGINVSLQDGLASNDGLGGGDTLIGIEQVRGSDFNDYLEGSDRATFVADGYYEAFEGRKGNDTIDGRGGSDVVQYGSARKGVHVDLLNGVATQDGYDTSDTLLNIEAVHGSSFGDTLIGGASGTRLEGRDGNDHLTGSANEAGIDLLFGGNGDDTIIGLAGNDTLDGGAGNDSLSGGEGNDNVLGGEGSDTIEGGDGNDRINGGAGNDLMLGGAGNDVFIEGNSFGGGIALSASTSAAVSGAGNDTIDGGVVTDRIAYTDLNVLSYFSTANGVVINLAGITGDGSTGQGTATSATTGTDTIRNINFLEGSNFADTITGSSALIFEQIEGLGGNDVLNGGAITDLVNTDNANRVSYRSAGAGVVVDLAAGTALTTDINAVNNSGNDALSNFSQVRGSGHADTIRGSDVSTYTELFEGAGGNDFIDGRGGFDILRYDNATGGVTVNLVNGAATGAGVGDDTFVNMEGAFGSAFDDLLVGGQATAGLDYSNTALIEVLRGGAGNDTLDGGAGFDRADYGSSTAGITVSLQNGEASNDGLGGNDVLIDIELVRGSDFNDALEGSDRDTYDTDGHFEAFEGRAGNDTIDGRGGVDVVQYSTARQGVHVSLITGLATQDGYGGTDTLSNIEGVTGSSFGDTLIGSNNSSRLEGRGGNDSLVGGDDSDTLIGGTGSDTMQGGGQDDTYYVDALTDQVIELADEGTDQVFVSLTAAGTYTLSANVENATITSALSGINLTGNALDNALVGGAGNNVLTGGAGNDTLSGGSGSDTLIGGAGDDLYVIDTLTDVVNETAAGSGGIDTVMMNIAAGVYTLGTNVENATLLTSGNVGITGNTGNNALIGGTGANSLVGSAGNDTLESGGGSDTLDGGIGTDLGVLAGNRSEWSTVSRTLATSAVITNGVDTVVVRDVESFEFDDQTISFLELVEGAPSPFDDFLTGTAGADNIDGLAGNDSISGFADNDSLTGGLGNDTLDGGTGNDTLNGGAGNDVYVVDAVGDVVQGEVALGGIDSIRTDLASFDLSSTAQVENLIYTGGLDFAGTGNALANSLVGGAGNDTLDGGLGNDTMAGGLGDDTYAINVLTDVIQEVDGAGTDTVLVNIASGAYVLGAHLENATAGGTGAINITGNALNNVIEGNTGNNSLVGGDGNDTLDGSAGVDTIDGGLGEDALILGGDRADYGSVQRLNVTDIRLSNGSETVTVRNVENFVFDDGTINLALLLDNALSTFNDSWVGTAGDDNSGDALAGNDTLNGLAGNDTLNGGLGNDSMLGGDGDDTFIVNVGTDVVVELENEGNDTVQVAFTAAGTYTLSANVENATITTALAGVNVTGNALDNLLSGGNGANVLNGGAGNDTLDGGLGNDNLIGGAGDDTYRLNVATDIVNETAVGSGGIDTVELGFTAAGTYAMTVNVENALVTAGEGVAANVTGNVLDNTITGHAGNNLLNGGLGNDTLVSNGGTDTLDGAAGNDRAVVLGDQGDYAISRINLTDATFTRSGESITLRNIETVEFGDGVQSVADLLALLGSPTNDNINGTVSNDTLSGGVGNDLLNGGEGDDQLDGGVGNDTLRGGAGTDLLLGGTGADTYRFGAGSGNDTVTEATDVATNIDVVVIDADSGNVADGQARFSRTGDDSNDLMLTLTNNDDGLASVDTLIVTDFFLNDLVNTTKTVEQFRFADGGVTLTQAQIQALLLQSTDGNDVLMGYANTNDSINGGLGNDTISGAGGNDILLGGAGDDVLDGGLGNDNLQGGSGADTLDGGLGNDTLTGGAGDDALTGGAGLDRFVLNSLTGSDTVTDFQVGVDKIALSKSVFTTITAAVGAVTNEAGLAAAGFDYDSGTGALTWDADGAGGEAAITLATLSNNLNLANDFLIIG